MTEPGTRRSRVPRVIGWVIAAIATFIFGLSAFMKMNRPPDFAEGMLHLGLPERLATPLAILEVACLVLYLVPQTAVLGAILLTGYLGGAIATHLRVGDPIVIQATLAVLIWIGAALREPRLWAVAPIRR